MPPADAEAGRDPALPAQTAGAHAAIDAKALLAGRREILIAHGEETYRLRLTSNNKLILTK